MNRIIKFMRMDIKTIKPYFTIKNLIVYLGIAAFLIYSNGSVFAGMGIILMFTTMFATYPFAVGDQNGIDSLYVILGLNRKEVVQGRYLFLVIANVMGVIISLIVSVLMSLVFKFQIDITEAVFSVLGIVIVMLIVQLIQYPFFFKLGYMKAKLISYLPYFLISIIFLIGVNLTQSISKMMSVETLNKIKEILIGIENNPLIVILVVILLLVILFAGSLKISEYYYSKREF